MMRTKNFSVLIILLTIICLSVLVSCDTVSQNEVGDCAKGHSFEGQPWLSDDVRHWQECSKCGELSDKVEHIPVEDDHDCTTPTLCADCGDELDMAQMRHRIAGSYSIVDGLHYRKCLNGDCNAFETHTLRNTGVTVVDGMHKVKCSCNLAEMHTPEWVDDDNDPSTPMVCNVCSIVKED